MARVELPVTLINSTTGVPVSGATATVKVRATASNATVYTTATGSTTLTQPLSSNSAGRVEGWVERGAYDIVISGSGITSYTEPFEAAPGGDQTVDVGWLVDASITQAKLDSAVSAKLETYYATLPAGTSWTDGTRIIIPNVTSDGYWTLRWSSGNTAWYFVGGTSSMVTHGTLSGGSSQTITSTSDPMTAVTGHTVTLPNKGTYQIRSEIDATSAGTGGGGYFFGVGTSATNAATYRWLDDHAQTGHRTLSSRTQTIQTTATSTTLAGYSRAAANGTGSSVTVHSGSMIVTPTKLVP